MKFGENRKPRFSVFEREKSTDGLFQRLNTKGGFSLVEVAVATAIIVLGVSVLIPALVFNIKTNAFSKAKGIANYLAEARLEKVRSWPRWETTTIGSQTMYGIETDNAQLFNTETWGNTGCSTCDNILAGTRQVFSVQAQLFWNGHGGASECAGLIFGGTVDDHILNTGVTEGTKGDCSSGNRGEDFKIAWVTVSWSDLMGGSGASRGKTHTINRYAYISKF